MAPKNQPKYMKKRNLKLFYLHELLYQFSDMMLVMVLPVFIYKTFQSLSAVFLFVMIWNVIHGILFLPVFNLAMKWKHPKFFMMMGVLFYMAAQSIFSLITPQTKWLIIPAIFAYAFYISFYWMVRHWFISINSDYKKIGKQMSIVYLLKTIVAFLAPIVGGAVSVLASFNAAFLVGILASALSLIPIALFSAPPHTEKVSYKNLTAILKRKEIRAMSPSYFCEGASFVMVAYPWTLAFAIFIGSILDLGILVGFTTLITGLTIWATGLWFDKRSRASLLTLLSKFRMLTVLGYTTVCFFPNIVYVWLIEFLNRLAYTSQGTVSDSYLYAYGNKLSPVDFMLVREILIISARFSMSAILALVFYFFPASALWIVLFFGSFTVLGIMYAKKGDHQLTDKAS